MPATRFRQLLRRIRYACGQLAMKAKINQIIKYYLKDILFCINTDEMILFGYSKNTLMPLTDRH